MMQVTMQGGGESYINSFRLFIEFIRSVVLRSLAPLQAYFYLSAQARARPCQSQVQRLAFLARKKQEHAQPTTIAPTPAQTGTLTVSLPFTDSLIDPRLASWVSLV
jgi:hypothetical protein